MRYRRKNAFIHPCTLAQDIAPDVKCASHLGERDDVRVAVVRFDVFLDVIRLDVADVTDVLAFLADLTVTSSAREGVSGPR